MKALVIGYGSIGRKHASILSNIGYEVSVLSNSEIDGYIAFKDINEALVQLPDYIVISNQTNQHFETLDFIAKHGYSGSVLTEKPLFAKYKTFPENNFSVNAVGYNLRFHPVIQKIKEELANENILTFNVYVGQYLPNWRRDSDYRKSYSSKKELGGGVLRDLSHELDYLTWILGKWKCLASNGGHFSKLKIDSDDVFTILLKYESCPSVTLQMSYLDRVPTRRIVVNTDNSTLEADLINNTIKHNDKSIFFELKEDQTYKEMHLAVVNKDYRFLSSAKEALSIIKMVETIERANKLEKWVKR